jgi:hypothetical protein
MKAKPGPTARKKTLADIYGMTKVVIQHIAYVAILVSHHFAA